MLYVDDTTQLYYLNARYYNPEDGNFISQDSYRGENTEQGTWHLYTYCANNPINYTDPSGHKWVYKRVTKQYLAPVVDAGWHTFTVQANLGVNYSKIKTGKNKGKKKINDMTFSAIGIKQNGCGNGDCRFVKTRIYNKGKVWKTIMWSNKVVKPGDPIMYSSSWCCYTNKKITKDYIVTKNKIKVWANFYFTPPTTSLGYQPGMAINPSVSF